MAARPLVIAHRGASGYRPEHTRSAYELAIRLGADAVEPDLVMSRDGVLVIRHENEISGTTDVAEHPEFAERRTTKTIDGVAHTGWFTEDFDWDELATLRCRERLPKTRPANTAYDGTERMLRLDDLVGILQQASREVTMVAELKHATYFAGLGLPLDRAFAEGISGFATAGNLVVESFEQNVLTQVQERGVLGRVVFLVDAEGAPADEVALAGSDARPFADYLTDEGLSRLSAEVDGVSVDKAILFADPDLIARAHDFGLETYTWTLRAENRFLEKRYRRGLRARDLGNWEAEFLAIYRMGVDGVFTDQPDLALRVR